MINIRAVLNEAKAIANGASHGYNMSSRLGPDYDCSSFVAHCLNAGGANIPSTMTTTNELEILTSVGFVEIGVNDSTLPGDIFVYDEGGGVNGHTFIVYDNARYVHASGAKGHPETGDQSQVIDSGYDYSGEICFGFLPYNLSTHTWYHLRYTETRTWITGNRALTETEKQNNAEIIYNYFYNLGYSLKSICAILGNMEFESYLCPDKWEDAYPIYEGGYGLIQWTPYTVYSDNFTDWATNHDRQLEFINGLDSVNYIPTTNYPLTWSEFKTSNESIDYLTKTYFYNRERGTWSSSRTTDALKWYEYFGGGPTPTRNIPVWLLIKIKNNLNGGY